MRPISSPSTHRNKTPWRTGRPSPGMSVAWWHHYSFERLFPQPLPKEVNWDNRRWEKEIRLKGRSCYTAFHTCTVLSLDPEAISEPSGDQATDQMVSWWLP